MSDQREITIKRNRERLGIGGAFTDLRTPGGGGASTDCFAPGGVEDKPKQSVTGAETLHGFKIRQLRLVPTVSGRKETDL